MDESLREDSLASVSKQIVKRVHDDSFYHVVATYTREDKKAKRSEEGGPEPYSYWGGNPSEDQKAQREEEGGLSPRSYYSTEAAD